VYIVWVISLPCPLLDPLSLFPPHFQAEPVLPLSLILLKRRHNYLLFHSTDILLGENVGGNDLLYTVDGNVN
jgi:hypothetical protein